MTCPHCVGAEELFGARQARADLKRYRAKGPLKTAEMLIDALRALGVEDKRLLDIGGGAGVLQHELLKAGMAGAVGVEAPHAGLTHALQTRLLPRRSGSAVLHAHVGRCADVHIDVVGLVERERLGCVTALLGEPGHDQLRLAPRHELARCHQVSIHLGGRREIQIVAAQLETRPVVVGEALDDLGAAIAVGIPKRDHPATGRVRVAAARASQVDVDDAVGGDIEVPGALESVGDHEGAEPRWQNQTAVVGVAHRQLE